MKHFHRFPFFLLAAATLWATSPGSRAVELPEKIEGFLSTHCYECHDDLTAEADLDLTELDFDLTDPHALSDWEHVFERVESGEMPPEKKPRPEAEELEAFLAAVEKPLHEADQEFLEANGRVHGRLLTRKQYENSLHDLLGIDIPLVDFLPPYEGRGFETVASDQQLSHFHLQKYLAAADAALDEAFARAGRKDVEFKKTFQAKELTAGMEGNYRGPQEWKGKTRVWRQNLQFSGRMLKTAVPASGWYRITLENYRGINPGPDGAVWGSIRTGACSSAEPLLFYAGTIEATGKPRTSTWEAWIEKGHMLEIEPNEGPDKQPQNISRGGKIFYKQRDLGKEGIAGIEFDSITLERFHPQADGWEIRSRLFPGVKFDKGKPMVEAPRAEVKRLVEEFAERAFRRPVSEEVTAPIVALAQAQWDRSKSLFGAARVGYRAVLCSPRFVGFVESPGRLDDHAVASRLSYFLWDTMPDQRLLDLAAKKQLSQPKMLAAEVERLLADPRSDQFVKAFTDQWLELKRIDFTSPDPRRFGQFDPIVQESMVGETRAFFRELLDQDLGVQHFVSSDFAMWNTRLREFYGATETEVKPGEGLQKVSLLEGNRGGLVTQGSVLKITADGSVTSPVLRGVWVNERILGIETPPPPPNVPAVEPDIRGAVSIRDQLARHSNDESCASCHAKIDPAGFALENYDPVGRYRIAYGTGKDAAKVDPSGVTPDGEAFGGIGQWKSIYASRPELLARNFTKQLLTYAVGEEMRFSDRETIDSILGNVSREGYGVRSLLQAAVASPIFLHK